MSPHYNVLPEAVCCCLQTCNYDHSLVVTDTKTYPQNFITSFLSYGCRTRRRRRRRTYDGGHGPIPILSTTVLSDTGASSTL